MAFFSLSTSVYHGVAISIIFVLLKVALDKVLSLWTAFSRIKDYPGRQLLWIGPMSPISLALGPTFPRPSMAGYAGAKYSFYKKFGVTSFASVIVSTAQPHFWLGDSEAIRIVSSDRHTFQKDLTSFKFVDVFGKNLVNSEGLDWKRHRMVTMSAFNEANIELSWAETMRVVNEWFKQLDAAGSVIPMDISQPMSEITLLIIASAGFGKRCSLAADSSTELSPAGCKLTFQSAVTDSADNIFFKAILPKWLYRFSRLIQVPYLSSRALITQLAFDDLQIHMLDLVASARAEITSGKPSDATGAALLWNLVKANMNKDEGSKRLSDAEVLSNVFVFLLGGHKTTAHTLSFAFSLLAIFQDCQQKLYEEVVRVWPEDVPVTQLTTDHNGHMAKLEYTFACIREVLRLFPTAPRVSKVVCKDTVLPGTHFAPGSEDNPSADNGNFSMFVPKGSVVCMDIWALHLNPLYWGDDAEEFRPERFIDTESYQWPRNAYMPFSGGPRSCIGQRFANVEMIAIIASVVRRYRILVPDDLVTKSLEEQKETLLAWTSSIALKPLNSRVKLSRRF